uniref:DUF222 domain-containing protein n=1 Tax=Arthrobacter sp. Br18 TaxID=1312954 RepID=UPI0012DE9766
MEAGAFDGGDDDGGGTGGTGGSGGTGPGCGGSLFEPVVDPLGESLLGPPALGLGLGEALEALEGLQVVKNRCDARSAVLIERIRNLATDRLYARTPGSTTCHDTTIPGFRPISDSLADSLAATEIGCALRLPERSARLLVDQAHLLCRKYTPTLGALAEGAITWRHAVTVIEQCVGLAPHTATTLEHALLPTARNTTVTRTMHRARVLRAGLDPGAHTARATAAVTQRRLEVLPDADGMAWLNIYLPAEHATGIGHRITALARGLQTPTENRTLTQLRVDVLTDLLTHTCTTGPPPQPTHTRAAGSPGPGGGGTGVPAAAGDVPGEVPGGVP